MRPHNIWLLGIVLLCVCLSSCDKFRKMGIGNDLPSSGKESTIDWSKCNYLGEDYLQIICINPVLTTFALREDATCADNIRFTFRMQSIEKQTSNNDAEYTVDKDLHILESRYDYTSVELSAKDSYKKEAYGTWIEPRLRPVKDEYISLFPNDYLKSVINLLVTYCYIKEPPTVVADKTLFGREAGEDLSDLFFLNNAVAIRVDGDGFKAVLNPSGGISFHDYYSPGTLLCHMTGLYTQSLPEELVPGEEASLNVNFSLKNELFWQYVLKKGKNEAAELQYYDWNVSIPVVLKR